MMVLNGTKPFATIQRNKDLDGYCMAVSLGHAGLLATEVGPTKDSCDGEIQLTLPGNSNRIVHYQYLLRDGVADMGIKEYHREMGRLFGYSDSDIEVFINAQIHCDCSKCQGDAYDNVQG